MACLSSLLWNPYLPHCKLWLTLHLFPFAETSHGFLSPIILLLKLWIQLSFGPSPTAVFLVCPVVLFETTNTFSARQSQQKAVVGLQCGLTAIRGRSCWTCVSMKYYLPHFDKAHAPVPDRLVPNLNVTQLNSGTLPLCLPYASLLPLGKLTLLLLLHSHTSLTFPTHSAGALP